MDYLTDLGTDSYNYDSAGVGGNRYATILLYMNDIPEGGGGETVFSEAFPPSTPVEERISTSEAIRRLRDDESTRGVLQPGSWEEGMTAKCRTRFAVQPKTARAVLFYSQHPDGREDTMSRHGGCPVLSEGVSKWAANLWVFSAPRENNKGAPVKPGWVPPAKTTNVPKKLLATFRNGGTKYNNPTAKIEVYYGETGFFGKLGPNDPPVSVNTYEGHVWNIKVNDSVVETFVIKSEPEVQEFSI
jgi:hypothetical protein